MDRFPLFVSFPLRCIRLLGELSPVCVIQFAVVRVLSVAPFAGSAACILPFASLIGMVDALVPSMTRISPCVLPSCVYAFTPDPVLFSSYPGTSATVGSAATAAAAAVGSEAVTLLMLVCSALSAFCRAVVSAVTL